MQNSIKKQTSFPVHKQIKTILYSHASNYTKMYRDRYFNINFEIITFNIIFFFNSLIRNFWVKEGLSSCRDI